MESGIISIRSLYETVASDPEGGGLNGRCPAGRAYGKAVGLATGDIVAAQGFYLWGKYEPNGLWRNIYLGKAGFGKTAHLRARIREELRDERCLLWRSVLREDRILAALEASYQSMWHVYRTHVQRALLKAGSTHIVWAADPTLSNKDVGIIESDLIETLNPIANVSRPIPPTSLQAHTRDVISAFRSMVHAHRDNRYVVSLVGAA